MYEIWIHLEGGAPYKLCEPNDLLALWAVIESLIGDGCKGVDAVGIVRKSLDGRQVHFRAPLP